MKTTLIRSVIRLLFPALLIMQTSCNDDNGTDAGITAFTDKLAKTWLTTSVILDGQDVTELFETMEITWSTNKTYAVASPVPPVWNAVGTYSVLKENGVFSIQRDGNLIIEVKELTENKVVISFQYDAIPAGARKTSVSGNYIFEMEPK